MKRKYFFFDIDGTLGLKLTNHMILVLPLTMVFAILLLRPGHEPTEIMAIAASPLIFQNKTA